MRKLSKILAAIVAMVACGSAFAAPPESGGRRLSISSLSYIVSFPTASMADFLGNSVSFRGLGFEWDTALGSSGLMGGISLRWLYFRDVEDNATVTTGNTTINGRFYRSVDSFPAALHLKYLVTSVSGPVLPYLGLGVGTIYGIKELDIGAFSQNQVGWQFLMSPEAGALISFSGQGAYGAVFSVRYDAGFGSDALGAISNLSLGIGITSHM